MLDEAQRGFTESASKGCIPLCASARAVEARYLRVAREELWSSAEPAAIAKFSVLPASVAETCGCVRHLADNLGVQWRVVVPDSM